MIHALQIVTIINRTAGSERERKKRENQKGCQDLGLVALFHLLLSTWLKLLSASLYVTNKGKISAVGRSAHQNNIQAAAGAGGQGRSLTLHRITSDLQSAKHPLSPHQEPTPKIDYSLTHANISLLLSMLTHIYTCLYKMRTHSHFLTVHILYLSIFSSQGFRNILCRSFLTELLDNCTYSGLHQQTSQRPPEQSSSSHAFSTHRRFKRKIFTEQTANYSAVKCKSGRPIKI